MDVQVTFSRIHESSLGRPVIPLYVLVAEPSRDVLEMSPLGIRRLLSCGRTAAALSIYAFPEAGQRPLPVSRGQPFV